MRAFLLLVDSVAANKMRTYSKTTRLRLIAVVLAMVCVATVAEGTSVAAQSTPQPPTNLALSLVQGDSDKLRVTYSLGTGSDYGEFRLVFGGHSTTTHYKTSFSAKDRDASSPVDFDSVDRGFWYKVQGRGCVDPEELERRKSDGQDGPVKGDDPTRQPRQVLECGDWGSLLDDAVEVPFEDSCIESLGTLVGSLTAEASWNTGCASGDDPNELNQYYSFYLSAASEVQVDMESDGDAYLYLMKGSGTEGDVLAEDNTGGGASDASVTHNSKAGLYTIRTTVSGGGSTTSFELTVSATADCAESKGMVTSTVTVSGSWGDECASLNRPGGYARYYSFFLGAKSNVTVNLSSTKDTYLYLLDGFGTEGRVLEFDDDGGTGSDSRLIPELSPGTYTIEATTFRSGETGDFSLDFRGVELVSCTEDLAILLGTVVKNASWTADCASVNQDGSYALYYRFTLSGYSRLQVDLTSTVDTYVNLLSGSTSGGAILNSDNNGGSGTNSQIDTLLDGGQFTVEATTASRGETGSFELTLRRTDACSENLGAISGVTERTGSWTSRCDDAEHPNKYDRLYYFTLDATTEVKIDLVSTTTNRFYLYEGIGTGGTSVPGSITGSGTQRSQRLKRLDAGTYTIETSAYLSYVIGDFTLTIDTLPITLGLLPPTNLNASFASTTTAVIDISYSLGSHSQGYQFETHRKDEAGGEFEERLGRTTVFFSVFHYPTSTTSSIHRQGYWYRVRGRACNWGPFECGEWRAWSNVVDPPYPVHIYSPSLLALGDESDIWSVPAGVTNIYAYVYFWNGEGLSDEAGRFRIKRVTSTGEPWIPETEFVVREQADSDTIPNAAAGWHLRFDVDKDAWDYDADEATDLNYARGIVTFHAGSDREGPRIAQAEVRVESPPLAPKRGSSAVDSATGGVKLSWSAGGSRHAALPDHFEVVVPDPSNPNGPPLYTKRDVDDAEASGALVITTDELAGGSYTSEVRHCNAAGGCSDKLDISFEMSSAVFQFTPNPITVGTTSDADNLWTVPTGTTSVYVDVQFSPDTEVVLHPGDIKINRVTKSGTTITVLDSFIIDDRADDGEISGLTEGSLVQIEVDPDAFRNDAPEVTLNFHSGTDAIGNKIAEATVKTQIQPSAPINGASSRDGDRAVVEFKWEAGAVLDTDTANYNPDYFYILVPDPDNEGSDHYSSPAIRDSSTIKTFEVAAWDEIPIGRHSAEVRHCNAQGGCSDTLDISFDVPELITPRQLALGNTSDDWTVPNHITEVYLDVSYSTPASADIGPGIITINRVVAPDQVESVHEVTGASSDGVLKYQGTGGTNTNVQAGDVLQVQVNKDAFDLNHPLVTLTFHSGSGTTGLALADATVQKETQPAKPTGGTATVDRAGDSVTFNWSAGTSPTGAVPHHYQVTVTGTDISETTDQTTLSISNTRTKPGEGSHTAEVRHCNEAGGCSEALTIGFTVLPPPEEIVIQDLGTDLEVGAQDDFSVRISNLLIGLTYGITVESNNSNGTLDAACSGTPSNIGNLTGGSSFTVHLTLHGCQVGIGQVKATITGISPVRSVSQDVDITPPAVLPPPSNLQITVNSAENQQLDVTYEPGIYPVFLHFELSKSSTLAGPFAPSQTGVTNRGAITFTNVDIGYWYRVEARNCDSSSASSPVWSGCGPASVPSGVYLLALFPPEGLEITPLAMKWKNAGDPADRKAKLTWQEVTQASGYQVDSIDPAGTLSANWDWHDVGASGLPQNGRTSTNSITIFLDDLLVNNDSFDFRVSAIHERTGDLANDGNSQPSEAITIIDNPLLQPGGSINGNSPPRSGQAVLNWAAIPDARQYSIRYRKLGRSPRTGTLRTPSGNYHHSDPGWPAGGDWPYYEDQTPPPDSSATSRAISGLSIGEIYAFRLNYETAGGKLVLSQR